MAIDTSIPQVAALKLAVEKRFGHPIETRSDFTLLAADIERTTRDHIAENTLRRLWGRISSYDTVFTRTLDILSKYIGHEQWKSYCDYLSKEKNPESEIVVEAVSIRVEDLKPGDKIRIGWLPDRICIVQYMGGRTFKAIDAKNATLQIGDTFECSLMLKNFPLFVENLIHGGEYCNRYTMGMINGITTLEKL
jgi:hypothetical protein